jgi:hypothetical protein
MVDTASLKIVLDHPGPYASAYVDVGRDTEDAAKQVELRSRAIGEGLVVQGCPGSLADRVVDRLREPTGAPGPAARMIVAAGDDIVLDDVVLRPSGAETMTWGPLPDVTAWTADHDGMPGPVLQVLADREGADLTLFQNWPGTAIAEEHVHGETLHITKVGVGDWAHLNYQRRSENVWRRNAQEVAGEIAALAERGVAWVALAGDLRAVGDIREALSEPVRGLLVELEAGGRAEDGSEPELDEAMDRAALDVVGRRKAAVADELAEQRQHDGAVAGLGPVLDALAQGQARTVVLDPPTLREQEVRLRDHPGIPAAPGSDRGAALRADLLVLAHAARTDADAVVTSDPDVASPHPEPGRLLHDGVAAILRWPTTRTTGRIENE